MATVTCSMHNLAGLTPHQICERIRAGRWRRPTADLAPGYTQANLAVVPCALAHDFLLFCQRNPPPCPLLAVLDPGDPEPREFAPGADIHTDIPRYRVYRDGVLAEEVDDLKVYWRDDLVSFLLGCGFTFEHPLTDIGMRMRHIELGMNIPMFITNRLCKPAGVFHGPLVVSMRPLPADEVVRAVQLPIVFRRCMGPPYMLVTPQLLAFVTCTVPTSAMRGPGAPGEVPVFWACGVTPQAVMMQAKLALALTHAPGHMFISDRRDSALAVL